MKSITIHRLSLQFDAGQITQGSDQQQAEQALDLINGVLQREPFGLGAQLIATPDEIEVESAGCRARKPKRRCKVCAKPERILSLGGKVVK